MTRRARNGRSRRGRAAADRAGEPIRVRLSDPGDIAASVPQLLGFHPTESLVLIGLGGVPATRVVVTGRADLPPARHARAAAADLTAGIRASDPRAVVVVVVSEAPDADGPDPELPHRELVHELLLALAVADLPVRDLLLVRAGRWWSYDCPLPCCAPGAGTPLPDGESELAAASVVSGTVIARDRDELVARIAPPDGAAGVAMAEACARTAVEVATKVAALGVEAVAAETWAAVREGARRCRAGAPADERLTDAEVARIVCGLRDPVVRDRALGLAVGADPGAAETLWTVCTRRAPAPLDAAPATLLAVSAWLHGDGALANIALDRALAGDPGYRLAGLLASALAAGVPPREIRAMVRDTVVTLSDEAPADAGA